MPQAKASLRGTLIPPWLAAVEAAAPSARSAAFAAPFDDLTRGCNSCHQQAGFPFVAIQRPTAPPFTNQRY